MLCASQHPLNIPKEDILIRKLDWQDCYESENCQIIELGSFLTGLVQCPEYDGQELLIVGLYDHVTLIYFVLCGISKCSIVLVKLTVI